MKNFVIINGVNSNTINGLGINELPPISKPSMRVLTEEIDGRDGDITTNLGYSAYDKTITIGLFGTGYDINNIISFFNGEGTITFSNEDDKYYKYKIINQIDYEALLKFKQATITFHCQPFKYPLTETPLEIEYDYIEQTGETLTLNNTGESILKLDLKGQCKQDSTSISGGDEYDSPTPDHPQQIHSCSGDNTIKIEGKNLFDKNTEVDNYYIDASGNITANAGFAYSALIPVEQTNYVLKGTTYETSTKRIHAYNSNGTWIKQITYEQITANNEYSIPITIDDSNIKYIRISIKINDTNVKVIKNSENTSYQVNLGTLKMRGIGTYEDYFVRNSGKNILPQNKYIASTTKNNITFTNNGDGTFNLSGTASANTTIEIIPNGNLQLEANQPYYLYSSVPYNGTTFNMSIPMTDDGATKFLLANGTYTPTTTPTNVRLQFYIASGQSINAQNIKLMLVKGTIAPEYYEPYGNEGQWCKYNAIGNVVLDGSETGWTSIQMSNVYGYYITIDNILSPSSATSLGLGLSNYFGIVTPGQNWGALVGSNNFAINNSNNTSTYVRFTKGEATNELTGFKTWLSTHNTIVYYALATPYLSLIEDETLISQLDNIQNAMSYEGQTNVSQVNNDKPFIISAKALEKGSDEVVVNNIGNIYAKPLLALEGNGIVNIYLNNNQVLQANVEDKMNIDIDTLEAYNPDTSVLLNRQVIGNYNSMTIPSGESIIKIDGALDKATISNYTRWL